MKSKKDWIGEIRAKALKQKEQETASKILDDVKNENLDGLYDIFNNFILDLLIKHKDKDIPLSSSDAIDLQDKVKSYLLKEIFSKYGVKGSK